MVIVLFFALISISVWNDTNQHVEQGLASYYSNKLQGRKTASGELYDKSKFTAAHKTIAFGTKIKVTNQQNGLSVVVNVNDRGPYVKGRIVDLSFAAAKKIGLLQQGVTKVKLEIFKRHEH